MPIKDLDIPTELEMIGILNHIDEKLDSNIMEYWEMIDIEHFSLLQILEKIDNA